MWQYILEKFGKVPSHFECYWSECSECGAEIKEPCKRLWRCKSRAINILKAHSKRELEERNRWIEKHKEYELKMLKEAVKHWT